MPTPPPPPSRLRAAAWVLYDLANTVYAATVTFLFTPYAKEALGGDLRGVGLVQFASMALAGVLVPVFGALLDQTARTRGYLTIATLLCIAATAAFGADVAPGWLLAAFFVANVAYNLGLLFYNALLPAVAAPGGEGRLSGLGTGVGYLGTIVVLAVLMPLPVGDAARFPLAALLFLVTAAPCLLLVRDPRRPRGNGSAAAVRAAFRQLGATLRDLPRQRALLWFLVGNFCLVDVLNTAVLYFADFTASVFHASAAQGPLRLLGVEFAGDGALRDFVIVLGLLLNGLALVFGLVQGPLSDRAPLAVMRSSGVALLVALGGGALFGGVSELGYALTLVAAGAYGLAGIWTAGRTVVVRLAPPERVGEYFGLYGITVKLSVVGGAVYGLVEYHAGAKPAMLAQGAQLLIGLLCLAMVRVPADRPAATPAR